jgi:homoserine kinase
VRGAGLPVCVSGSGPTLLAFEQEGRTVPDLGEGWRVLRLSVRASGVEVEEARG